MISDPRDPANQAYVPQQYVQQVSTTPQQIYYQEAVKDSNNLSNVILTVIPNVIIFLAFFSFAFFYGLFDGELDDFLDFFSFYLLLYWLFTSLSVTMLSTYLAFHNKASKLWQVVGPLLGFVTSLLTLSLISAIFDSEAFIDNFGNEVLPIFGAAIIAHIIISSMTMFLLTITISRD